MLNAESFYHYTTAANMQTGLGVEGRLVDSWGELLLVQSCTKLEVELDALSSSKVDWQLC